MMMKDVRFAGNFKKMYETVVEGSGPAGLNAASEKSG